MSALAVAGYSVGTVAAIGVAAIAALHLSGGFKFDFSFRQMTPQELEEHEARRLRETIVAFGILAAGVGAGALVAARTSHVDMGKGIMCGFGGIATILAFDMAFPKALLARKEES